MNAIVSKLPAVARILLGLVFFIFGLNGFLSFMALPPMPEPAGAFLGALAGTGYLFPVLKTTEIIAGLMLLSGRFVPLALTLLAPVIVNIAFFHAVLAPGGLGTVVFILVLEVFLAWAYRDSFRGVLDPKAQPRLGDRAEARGRAEAQATA